MTSLSDLVTKAASAIDAAEDLAALDAVRVAYLGKKGEITARLKTLGQLPAEERSAAGQEINQAKQAVLERLNQRRTALEAAALEAKLAAEPRGRRRDELIDPQGNEAYVNPGMYRSKLAAGPEHPFVRALAPGGEAPGVGDDGEEPAEH